MRNDTSRELPTKVLTWKIKREEVERTIRALKTETGEMLHKASSIRNEMWQHFQSRYAQKDADPGKLSNYITRLNNQCLNDLRKAPTLEEIFHVAEKARPGSAPGIDGLPYRLYLRVPSIAALLLRVINWTIKKGAVPKSWNEGIIRCLPKDGKDRMLAESYRPISLCCTDAKILMGIWAARMQKYADTIFGPNQTGYLQRRSPHLAIMRVADRFKRHPEEKPVLLDYDKAYDRVDHEWVNIVLMKSGFPTTVRTVINSMLLGMRSKIIVNNELTEWIYHKSGVRQGDPFSPLLFLLCIQPLLNKMSKKGIFNQAHCDDLILGAKKANMKEILECLDDYDSASGSKVNLSKSTIISKQTSLPFQHPFKVSEGDRYLGIWLTVNGKIKTMPDMIKKVEEKMKRMKKLYLSWAGKESVLQCYLRPMYLYQLITANTDIKKIIALEKWFLSNTLEEFDSNDKRNYPLANEKMKHPVTRLRLQPLEDVIEITRARILIAMAKSPLGEIIPGTRNREGWPRAMTNAEYVQQLQDLPITLWLKAWHNTDMPKHVILSKPPPLANLEELKKITKRIQTNKTLPLSPGQQELFQQHNTDPVQLMSTLKKMKHRCGILSFSWKLINCKIHVHLVGQGTKNCPWCDMSITTKHILNGDCPPLKDFHGHYEKLLNNRGKKKKHTQTHLIHVWSIWKAWCYMQHSNSATTLTLFLEHISLNLTQEMERLRYF
jgi:hypothetical protein